MRKKIISLVCGCMIMGLLVPATAWAQGGAGSIEASGQNQLGQGSVPPPNANFVAVASGHNHSLGLKANGDAVSW